LPDSTTVPRRTSPAGAGRAAFRDALEVFALSRVLVFAVGVFAALKLSPSASGNERVYDDPAVTHPFGDWPLDDLLDLVFSAFARWDAVYYLTIAHDGYGGSEGEVRSGFFPLYPLLVHVASALGASRGLVLIAAYGVSLAAFLGALYLLHRLVSLELGERYAKPTLLLLAFFPGALFFGIPYSEGVFLLVTVGAVYAARTGHWATAGALAALASAARIPGLAVLVPLAWIYWDAHGRRLGLDAAWLALAPLGLLLYSLHLGAVLDDPLAWFSVQNEGQDRDVALPFAAIVEGARAAGAGAIDLAEGVDDTFPASQNIVDFGFLAAILVALVGALRRLPGPYAAYAVAALALPLSTPFPSEPLVSVQRYAATVFPLFMWLALVCEERGWTSRAVAVFAVLLGASAAQFATWQWVG
jgi:Mannosyltransferase (PIG-V)